MCRASLTEQYKLLPAKGGDALLLDLAKLMTAYQCYFRERERERERNDSLFRAWELELELKDVANEDECFSDEGELNKKENGYFPTE